MKADFLLFRRKDQKRARFMDDTLKTRSIKMFKCLNSVVVFPNPNKISSYAPGCTASSIYQKILCFVFDLINAVIISSSIFYLSKLTKFELIIIIFEQNCVYLSSQN